MKSEGAMKFRDQSVDWPTTLARFGDDFDRVSRMGRLFIEKTPLRMDALSVALHTRDAVGVHHSAEAVRDLLDALGAPEAASIADQIAHCGYGGKLRRAGILFVDLRRDVTRLRAIVKTWPPLQAVAAA